MAYLGSSFKKKESEDNDNDNDKKYHLPSFFIYPTRNYMTTILKAPMAHKTFSQEQFGVRYYSLSIAFSIKLESSGKNITNYLNELWTRKVTSPTPKILKREERRVSA